MFQVYVLTVESGDNLLGVYATEAGAKSAIPGGEEAKSYVEGNTTYVEASNGLTYFITPTALYAKSVEELRRVG